MVRFERGADSGDPPCPRGRWNRVAIRAELIADQRNVPLPRPVRGKRDAARDGLRGPSLGSIQIKVVARQITRNILHLVLQVRSRGWKRNVLVVNPVVLAP